MEEELIKNLKRQHKDLEKVMRELFQEVDGSFDVDKIVESLNLLKSEFYEHIKLENDLFYPKVKHSLECSGESCNMIDNFLQQIKFVESKADKFFNLFSDKKSIIDMGRKRFQNNFIDFMTNLEIRMNVEELFIYREVLEM